MTGDATDQRKEKPSAAVFIMLMAGLGQKAAFEQSSGAANPSAC
jgi:hypothetical protein